MQDIPKTIEQREFEQLSQALIKILSELTHEERKHIFNYVVFTYNK